MKKEIKAYVKSLAYPALVVLGEKKLDSKSVREDFIDPTIVILKDRVSSAAMCGKIGFGIGAKLKHPKAVFLCTAAGVIIGAAGGPKAAETIERLCGNFGRAASAAIGNDNNKDPAALPAPQADSEVVAPPKKGPQDPAI